MTKEQYLKHLDRVLVRNHQDEEPLPAVFLGFVAGGTEEENEGDKIYNCRLKDGKEQRFAECLPVAG